MQFEEWLSQKRFSDADGDIVVDFARRFTVGPLAIHWRPPIDSLDKLRAFVEKATAQLSKKVQGSAKFAAETAWNDYLKENDKCEK